MNNSQVELMQEMYKLASECFYYEYVDINCASEERRILEGKIHQLFPEEAHLIIG